VKRTSFKEEGVNAREFFSFYRWFKSYVKGFYQGKTKEEQGIIALKEKHTLRVCQEIVRIGKELGLNLPQLFLAKTIGLFHDVGRFEQYEKYGTFRDAHSENHALLSVKTIKREKILQHLPLNIQEIICNAIMYHNVRLLPKGLSPEMEFYSKLIRDADKLDVFHVFVMHYERPLSSKSTIELDLPEGNGYSFAIINDILNNRISDLKLMQCKNDMKLMLLSWLFDINFLPTLKEIRKRGYVERIISYLPQTEDIQKVKRHLEKYLQGDHSGLAEINKE